MNSQLISTLNEAQQAAVTADSQHTLILAGAGSGKTRVLVHRIAWLCLEKAYPPSSIFAVTFTNKAANEMQTRIQALIGEGVYNNMWVGTFHGLTHRLLRIFHKQAKLSANFQLIDTEDQHRLIKRIFRELKIDEKRWSTKECLGYISTQKEKGIRAHVIEPTDPKESMWKNVYHDYQVICDRVGYVDFSELILRTYELLCRDSGVLDYCHRRFCHILIDEFQDTNHIQYQLVKKLAGDHANVMIVGDDDQAIYGWRGADADNLQQFITDYPDSDIIRLEQNYRSTGTILAVANHIIAHNQKRLGKSLWTESGAGEHVDLYVGFNDIDEARFVVGKIKQLHEQGEKYAECAILYRNNVQSRLLEDTLLQAGLPYQIYGSIRFYERREIKLALAYLRLIHDHNNDMAFELAVNTPTRGIGESTLDKIRNLASQHQQSMWISCVQLIESQAITARQRASIARFLELIETINKESYELPFHKQLAYVLDASGINAMYEQESGIKGQSRLENLEELVSGAEQFYDAHQDGDIIDAETGRTLTALEAFLSYTSLDSDSSVDKGQQDAIQLMTLHSAKGLEFDHVFIVGMEENIFPSQRALLEQSKMEEERRLAYVGITRTRKHLTLTLSESRRLYGREERNPPSQFLAELPEKLLNVLSYRQIELVKKTNESKEVIASTEREQRSASLLQQKNENNGFNLGCRVRHPRFGEGTIINLDGIGMHRRVQVAFVDNGIKWLVIQLSNLTLL